MPSFDFPEIPKIGGVEIFTEDSPREAFFDVENMTIVHSIKIIVPGDPVPKGRPRARIVDADRKKSRFVSFYQPVETKSYERAVGYHARQAMRGRGLLIGALLLEVGVYLSPPASWSNLKKEKSHRGMIFPTSRPDADNFLKLAADACNGICWKDDAQIVDMRVSKCYSDNPRLEIEIFPA